MDSRTVLLLDIDGTLNPSECRGWLRDQWTEGKAEDDHGLVWRVRAAKPVVEFFAKLHESGLAEIRWHTAWQQSANVYGAVVGLPEFPIQPPHPNGPIRRSRNWKLEAVLFSASKSNQVIWVDDDAQHGWVSSWECIRPSGNCGLQKEHLLEIARLVGMERNSDM